MRSPIASALAHRWPKKHGCLPQYCCPQTSPQSPLGCFVVAFEIILWIWKKKHFLWENAATAKCFRSTKMFERMLAWCTKAEPQLFFNGDYFEVTLDTKCSSDLKSSSLRDQQFLALDQCAWEFKGPLALRIGELRTPAFSFKIRVTSVAGTFQADCQKRRNSRSPS